jgi:hypothetical protein
MPLNVQIKLECDENLALLIQASRAKYAKAFKGAWMEHDQKFASNKTNVKRLASLCNTMIHK